MLLLPFLLLFDDLSQYPQYPLYLCWSWRTGKFVRFVISMAGNSSKQGSVDYNAIFLGWIISNLKGAWKHGICVWKISKKVDLETVFGLIQFYIWNTQTNVIFNLNFDKWKKMQKIIAISTCFLQKIYIWTNKSSRPIQKFWCTLLTKLPIGGRPKRSNFLFLGLKSLFCSS
jgi:hypothetical protein